MECLRSCSDAIYLSGLIFFRCHYAMQKVLEAQSAQGILDESHLGQF